MNENGFGVKKDSTKAVELFRNAASHGSVRAQLCLSNFCRDSDGVPKDEVKAFQLMEKAAAQGAASALFNFEEMYSFGYSGPFPEAGIEPTRSRQNQTIRRTE
jgi:TPR repeat protein